MRLTCNKCKHSWNDDVSVGSAGVMCPECMAFVPLVLATGGAGAAPAGRSVHEEQTIITGGAGNIHEMPTVMPTPSPVAAPRSATNVPQQSAPRPAPSGGSALPPPPPNMPKFATQQGAAGPSGFDNGPDVYRIDAEGQTMPAPPRSGTQVPIATAASEDHTVLTPSQVAAKRAPVDDSSARTPTIRQMDATSGPEDQTMPSRPGPTPGGAATQQGGASKPSAAQAAAVAPGKMDLTGQVIGGYEISKKLGAGGMGAVFMARQISLDRMVAMKVLPSQMAENPDLLMRFTREALSAAQLTHHNIIQVYDVGSVDTLHYITMEFVKGASLGDIIRKDGKLTFDDAAAYVLQAARGLKYAHERGIIHRDIKPDNLMVNEHGIVKIADMGLAKMTGEVAKAHGKRDLEKEQLLLQEAVGDLTMAEVAMGTPAYMPPEQARDAGSVDHRADQYSLGCTLYYLCAGRAPYSGTTAYELITKHMNEPLTPLETVVKGVPTALSRIIARMLEKEPESRYPSLGEAIKDLEAYLGVAAEGGEYKPREQHLAILEQNAKAYYSAKTMPLRKYVPLGFFGLMALFAVASIFGGKFVLAGGFIGFAVLTPVANFIIDGILTKSFLFRRVRSVFFGMTMRGWIYTVLLALIGAATLWFLQLLWAWMGFSIAAIGAGAAYHFAVQRRLRQERAAAIQNMQEMLKQLRVRGVPEDGLQDFTGRFAGDNWEEFFEDLFGYDAMMVQRGKWAAQDKIRPRKKFATWRDSIFRFLDDLEQGRKVARERAQLKKVEVQRLKSQGIDQAAAEKQADMEATRILAEDLLPKAQKMSEASAGAGTARTLNLRGGFFKPAMIFGLVRFAIGLLITGAAAHRILGKDSNFPGFVVSLFSTLIYNNSPSGKLPYIGVDSSLLMVVVGAMLLVMAFSKRHVLQTIALLGAAMVVATNLILPLLPVPGLNNTLLYFAGAGIVTGVFAYCLYSKMGGGKF